MKPLIKRIYHPYWLWEETKYNLWGHVASHDEWLRKAIRFTGDYKLYGKWMRKVIKNWKYSCEHNLSNLESNRKAWLGHAAIALAIRCPEYITREAWGYLSEKQQNFANKEAQKAIDLWEKKYKNYAQEKIRQKRTRSI